MEAVFNNFYASAKEPWEWICLVIDPTKLSAKVRAWARWLPRSLCPGGGKGCRSAGTQAISSKLSLWRTTTSGVAIQVTFEPAAPVGSTPPPAGYTASPDAPLFPHLYGTINYDAVVREARLRRDQDGRFAGIEGIVDSHPHASS